MPFLNSKNSRPFAIMWVFLNASHREVHPGSKHGSMSMPQNRGSASGLGGQDSHLEPIR